MGEANDRGSEEERAAAAQWSDRVRAAHEVVLDAAALIEVVDSIVAEERGAGLYAKRAGELESKGFSEGAVERERRSDLLRVAAQLATGTSFLESEEGDGDEIEDPPEALLPRPRAIPRTGPTNARGPLGTESRGLTQAESKRMQSALADDLLPRPDA